MSANDLQRLLLRSSLKTLKLPAMPAEFDQLAREAIDSGQGPERYLLGLTELEVAARAASAVSARMRAADFPQAKDFDTLDQVAPSPTRLRESGLRQSTVSGDGRWLVQGTGAGTGEVALWEADPQSGRISLRHSLPIKPSRLALSHDAAYLAVNQSALIRGTATGAIEAWSNAVRVCPKTAS